MKKNYRVLVLSDVHDEPDHTDWRTLNPVLDYASTQRWDEVIFLGDFLNMDCISFFNKGKPRLTEGMTLDDTFKHGQKTLDKIEKATRAKNKKVKFTFLLGNHCDRAERLIDEMPTFRGIAEVQQGLRLKERGYKVIDNWRKGEVHIIGKLLFTHGLRSAPDNHAKMMVDRYSGYCVMYGHWHCVQEYSKIKFGDDNALFGVCVGTLGTYRPEYMGQRPSAWQQAFAEVTFRPDGFFNHFVTRIFDHAFVAPNGQFYKG